MNYSRDCARGDIASDSIVLPAGQNVPHDPVKLPEDIAEPAPSHTFGALEGHTDDYTTEDASGVLSATDPALRRRCDDESNRQSHDAHAVRREDSLPPGSTAAAPMKAHRTKALRKKRSSGSRGPGGGPLPAAWSGGRRYQSLGRRMARARWACCIFLPYLLLVLHRLADIQQLASVGEWFTPLAVSAVSSLLAVFLITNEMLQGPLWPQYVLVTMLGLGSALVFPAVVDLQFMRLVVALFAGLSCGQLRYHWEMRTTGTGPQRGPPAFLCSLSLWLMIGELVGVALFDASGWQTISRSWTGYAILLMTPIATYKVSTLLSHVIVLVFGSKRNISDGTRLLAFYWVITTVLSLLIMCIAIWFFISNAIALVWSLQLLMAPWGVVLDFLSCESRKTQSSNPYADVAARFHDKINTSLAESKSAGHLH